MPVTNKNDVTSISLDSETRELINLANQTYKDNFNGDVWLGRCVFLSWYCSKGTCDFCFRSTQKHLIKFSDNARRTKESVYSEAFICKVLGWELEFLTGGYGVYEFEEILEFCKNCSDIFNKKIWINLGLLDEHELLQLKPYVEGIVSSIETSDKELHRKICPDKNLGEYLDFLKLAKDNGFKTGVTIVLGLGETFDSYIDLKKILSDNNVSRITFYPLRPVIGTPYAHGPEPEYVVRWVAKTRIDFPTLDIVVGSAETRIIEIPLYIEAGANAFTKIPATKLFGTEKAKIIVDSLKKTGRRFTGELCVLPKVDWKKEISRTNLDKDLAEKVYSKLLEYQEKYLD